MASSRIRHPVPPIHPVRPTSRPPGRPICTVCAEEMVEILLVVDGTELTLRACATCDRRTWSRGGVAVDLENVLADLSILPTRYRHDLRVGPRS